VFLCGPSPGESRLGKTRPGVSGPGESRPGESRLGESRLGERWLARLAEKAGPARAGQKARVTARIRVPSGRMVPGFGAVDRGALLVIRSWCADGALRLGRGPVKSHRASVQGGPHWHFPCSDPVGSDGSWACHGRTNGRGGADPPPTGCLAIAAGKPRGHASAGSGHGAPATGAPVRINGAPPGWSKSARIATGYLTPVGGRSRTSELQRICYHLVEM